MATLTFDHKMITKELQRKAEVMKADTNRAAYRALNAVAKKRLTKHVSAIAKITGQKTGTIRKGFAGGAKINKLAFKDRLRAEWKFTGFRFPVKKPLPVMKTFTNKKTKAKSKKQIGASFIPYQKKRKKIIEPVRTGSSKPFVIKGQHSGKHVMVFRPPGLKRKVISFETASRQHAERRAALDMPELKAGDRQELLDKFEQQLSKSKYYKRKT